MLWSGSNHNINAGCILVWRTTPIIFKIENGSCVTILILAFTWKTKLFTKEIFYCILWGNKFFTVFKLTINWSTTHTYRSSCCINVRTVRSNTTNPLHPTYFCWRASNVLKKINLRLTYETHCVKSVRIWNYSVPYFPAFGLNTYLSTFSPNAAKCGP